MDFMIQMILDIFRTYYVFDFQVFQKFVVVYHKTGLPSTSAGIGIGTRQDKTALGDACQASGAVPADYGQIYADCDHDASIHSEMKSRLSNAA